MPVLLILGMFLMFLIGSFGFFLWPVALVGLWLLGSGRPGLAWVITWVMALTILIHMFAL